MEKNFQGSTVAMMSKATRTVLLLVACCMAMARMAGACPRQCDCKLFDNGTVVHCRYQSIDNVPTDFPDNTVEIDFGYNNISEISSSTFQYLPVLRKLVLDYCNIRSIGDRAFTSMPVLSDLILRDNSISNIHISAFQGIPQLHVLDLENNNLKAIPELLFKDMNLRELIIRGNGLTHLPSEAFDRTRVETLDIGFNNFRTIPRESLNSLQNGLRIFRLTNNGQALTLPNDIFSGFSFHELNLYGNQIDDASFMQHVSATILNVGGNRFGNMNFRQYTSLQATEEFLIQNSEISHLDPSAFVNLNNLIVLDVSKNKITNIEGEVFQHVPLLRKLDLGNNQLKNLPNNFGEYLSTVHELILIRNMLETLDEKSFSGMNLTSLDLRYNLLQVIPESMGPVFDSIKYLHLEGNPLHCNCEMRWFRSWLEKFRFFTGAEHCYTPDYEYIWNILPADFKCDPPQIYFVTENSTVLEGEDHMLTCVARGDPAPEMEWISPDGRSLTHINPNSNRTHHKTFVSVKIQKMQKYQAGIYKCVAYSIVAKTSTDVYLSITDELPEVTIPPTTPSTTVTTTEEVTTEATTLLPTTLEDQETTTIGAESDKTTTELNITRTSNSSIFNTTGDPVPVPVDHRGPKLGGAFVAIIIIVLIACIVIAVVLVVLGVMMRQRKFVREYDVSSGKLKILDTTEGEISKDPLDLNETQPEEKRPIGISSV